MGSLPPPRASAEPRAPCDRTWRHLLATARCARHPVHPLAPLAGGEVGPGKAERLEDIPQDPSGRATAVGKHRCDEVAVLAAVGRGRQLRDARRGETGRADQPCPRLPDQPRPPRTQHRRDDADRQSVADQGNTDRRQQSPPHGSTEQGTHAVVEGRRREGSVPVRDQDRPPARVWDDDHWAEPVQRPLPYRRHPGVHEQQTAAARPGCRGRAVTEARIGAHRDSVPLALGMPCTRGSGATAARRALATALNWASTMW
jgi:hypothetical protein